jgi:hypothetical protein
MCGGILPYDVALGAGGSLDLIKRRYVRHYLFGSQSYRKAGKGRMKTDQDFQRDYGLLNSQIKI